MQLVEEGRKRECAKEIKHYSSLKFSTCS